MITPKGLLEEIKELKEKHEGQKPKITLKPISLADFILIQLSKRNKGPKTIKKPKRLIRARFGKRK